MKHTIAAGLVCILLALALVGAARAGVWDNPPVVFCYASDGVTVETISGGRTSPEFAPYPIEVHGSVEDRGDMLIARHEAWLQRLNRHTYLPWVGR